MRTTIVEAHAEYNANGFLFRGLGALIAKILGEHPQRVGDAGAESQRLRDQPGKYLDVIDSGALRQVAERRTAVHPCSDLGIHQ